MYSKWLSDQWFVDDMCRIWSSPCPCTTAPATTMLVMADVDSVRYPWGATTHHAVGGADRLVNPVAQMPADKVTENPAENQAAMEKPVKNNA